MICRYPDITWIKPRRTFFKSPAKIRQSFATIGSLDVGKEADLIVVDLAALLPYGKQGRGFDDLSTEDILALCIYRGGPRANLATYVRGKCVYRAPELAARV